MGVKQGAIFSVGKVQIEIWPQEQLMIVGYAGKKLEIEGAEDCRAFILAMVSLMAARDYESKA